MEELRISVIVTNWKRQRFIPEIVDQLASQSYPKDKYEVIIVDDDTPDKEEVYKIVREVVHKYDDIRFRFFETHKQVTLNPALRYNIGARNASGEVIILNESDILMQEEYLQRVNLRHSQDPKLHLSPRIICVEPDGGRWEETFRGPTDLGSSVRREHYYSIRGFDERTRGWGGIESDFIHRLAMMHIRAIKDQELFALDRRVELCGINPKDFFRDAARPAADYGCCPPFIGAVPNPETWGTLNTLEEIRF